jgi:hypothetical protein
MTTHFRTSNPSTMHRDSAIDKRKATVKAQVERDWGIRPQNPVLKPSEASAFSTLQRQMAEANLDRVALQKQGGPRAVEQKERAENLFSANQHRSTK